MTTEQICWLIYAVGACLMTGYAYRRLHGDIPVPAGFVIGLIWPISLLVWIGSMLPGERQSWR